MDHEPHWLSVHPGRDIEQKDQTMYLGNRASELQVRERLTITLHRVVEDTASISMATATSNVPQLYEVCLLPRCAFLVLMELSLDRAADRP